MDPDLRQDDGEWRAFHDDRIVEGRETQNPSIFTGCLRLIG